MLGDDPVKEVLHAINFGTIPSGWNDTEIVMIPKFKSPEKVTQFGPINLCNMVYKVISKMLAAHLQILLPESISPTQRAFVLGRMITDNVLLAYEYYHMIKKSNIFERGPLDIRLLTIYVLSN